MQKLFAAVLIYGLLMLSSIAFAQQSKVLFVNGMHSNNAKVTLLKEMAALQGIKIERIAQTELKDNAKAAEKFAEYDLVLFDAVSSRQSQIAFAQYTPVVAQTKSRFVAIKWLENAELLKGLTMEQGQAIHDYYSNGGKENFVRMLDFLNYKIFSNDNRKVAAPIIYPQMGIYYPEYEGLVFNSRADYHNWKKPDAEKPTVAVLMQRALIESVQTQVVDETINQLEAKGVNVLPFFFQLSPFAKDYTHLLQEGDKTVVDIIVNFRNIHWANKRKAEFEKLGVPVIQALTYFDGDQKHWEENAMGISPTMTPFILVLPEAAGVIDPTIVAAINDDTGSAEVIDYQMDYLIGKTLNWVNLKYTANADKRIATMIWGDKDVGASFLNVPESVHFISELLNEQGYNIQKVDSEFFTDRVHRILTPFYRDYDLDQLLEGDLAELMPVDDYLTWFNTLPEYKTKTVNDFWGHPNDNFMVVERDGKHYFVMPRIRIGNMLIMRQPPRGDNKDQDDLLYHKGEVPINHFYLAAYYYAREYWNSDALIHLGTHGSQEYLGGKERGLSRFDDGNLAVGDTPVLYPFIVDDVGEAMQTKRRGNAVVLSHMTPPFAAAGLQQDLANIHELMHQYKAMDDGGVKKKTGQRIIEECIDTNVCKDFGWQREQIETDFTGFLEALHDYMAELAAENQPLGLHSYGELPEPRLLTSTLTQMLGAEFFKLVGAFELDQYGSEHHSHGSDHDHDHEKDSHSHDEGEHDHNHGGHEGSTELEELTGFKTVRDFVVNNESLSQELVKAFDDMGKELQAQIETGRKMYQRLSGIKELDNLISVLSGKYVTVKNGGDPIRHPEAIPTGFNLYGFDPSKVPTEAAFEQGKELTEGVIADYYDEHGKYPDKLAFSLWSIETMRHYGVLEAQALYAMGVRPKWSPDGRVIGTDIIPMSELNRPRVDVVLSATGLYRDAFPNVMQRLAKAVEQVAALKGESNFVWRNSERIKSELIADGVEEKEAEYLSTVRLFSNSSGNYGSGVDGPVFNSDTWETDAKIAENYMSKMGYFYGSDNSRWGQQLKNVNLYAKQLSGTDVALFSRSSNIYGMLSTDDPFEYFGSLALAVRNIDGASPEMMISNLRDANNPKAESAANFLSKELRTRNFHKRWVEEMMKEDYSGAVTMAANLSNFWGWQVVDPNVVRDDQWQEFYEVYLEDKLDVGINEFFEEVNPQSQAQMLETMLEANRKEYWEADQLTLENMIARYVELVETYDLFIDNEKLREFVDQQAVGFGLQPLPASLEAIEAAVAEMQEVEGQKLEKVEQPQPTEEEWDVQLMLMFAACLLTVFLGVWNQLSQASREPQTA